MDFWLIDWVNYSRPNELLQPSRPRSRWWNQRSELEFGKPWSIRWICHLSICGRFWTETSESLTAKGETRSDPTAASGYDFGDDVWFWYQLVGVIGGCLWGWNIWCDWGLLWLRVVIGWWWIECMLFTGRYLYRGLFLLTSFRYRWVRMRYSYETLWRT